MGHVFHRGPLGAEGLRAAKALFDTSQDSPELDSACAPVHALEHRRRPVVLQRFARWFGQCAPQLERRRVAGGGRRRGCPPPPPVGGAPFSRPPPFPPPPRTSPPGT